MPLKHCKEIPRGYMEVHHVEIRTLRLCGCKPLPLRVATLPCALPISEKGKIAKQARHARLSDPLVHPAMHKKGTQTHHASPHLNIGRPGMRLIPRCGEPSRRHDKRQIHPPPQASSETVVGAQRHNFPVAKSGQIYLPAVEGWLPEEGHKYKPVEMFRSRALAAGQLSQLPRVAEE
jgi:hypothetical protein